MAAFIPAVVFSVVLEYTYCFLSVGFLITQAVRVYNITHDWDQQLRSNVGIEDPRRYNEVVDTSKKNSVLIAPLNALMVPNYDQAAEQVHMHRKRVLAFERMTGPSHT